MILRTMAPLSIAASLVVMTAVASVETVVPNTAEPQDCVVGDDGTCLDGHDDDAAAYHDEEWDESDEFVYHEDMSLLDVLNPDILHNATLMQEIAERLQVHDLVILRDAFQPEFADYVWEELFRDDLEWPHWDEWNEDGFTYSHHNFYDEDVS